MDAKQSDQLAFYQKLADDYDRRFSRENPNHLYKIAEIARSLFAALPERADGYDILEVGGGTGIHARHFLGAYSSRVRSFVLSDLSPAMLEQARARLGEFAQVEYLVSPGESLATERSFDGIYVSGAMHHFSDPARSIVEMRVHLRPGGVLVVCEPNVWNPANLLLALSMREDWGQFSVTRRNIRALLKSNGFDIATDRVLHWKGGPALARTLWPYDRLERVHALDPLAVMFLFGATRRD
jgi:ubiquinone/menaquinone biosynthesis C-methylase UbiE